MNTNKKTLWGVIVLIVILSAGFGIWRAKRDARLAAENQNQGPSLTDVLGNPNASLPQKATTTASTQAHRQPSKAYTDALAAYQYRIQFSQCHGTINIAGTGTLAVKKGSKIMLDNRDPVSRIIAFKGVSVRVAGENFAVVTANTIGTYPVTCDGGGAATLKVQ